jgi:hypothetical protein
MVNRSPASVDSLCFVSELENPSPKVPAHSLPKELAHVEPMARLTDL